MCSKNGFYRFNEIEKKWEEFWQERKTFRAEDCDNSMPKYYVLDMFPYPSGEVCTSGIRGAIPASDFSNSIPAWLGCKG